MRRDDLDFGSRPFGVAENEAEAIRQRRIAAWGLLQQATGVRRVARCSQVHGSAVAVCESLPAVGVRVLGECDALVTRREGVLLTITVADCIPVFMVEPERRVLGLAHAGWRGAAAGVVEATLGAMSDAGADIDDLRVHLGPAICGACYEVGPEVAAALGREATGGTRVDLREYVGGVLLDSGVDPAQLTVSAVCTRHDPGSYFSYRGNDESQRMCAFLGWPVG